MHSCHLSTQCCQTSLLGQRLRIQIHLQIKQVQYIESIIAIDIEDLEYNLIMIHLIILIVEWVECGEEAEEVDGDAVFTLRKIKIKQFAKIVTLVAEYSRKILYKMFLFEI